MPARITFPEFVEKATKTHEGKYDYSNSIYVGSNKK